MEKTYKIYYKNLGVETFKGTDEAFAEKIRNERENDNPIQYYEVIDDPTKSKNDNEEER